MPYDPDRRISGLLVFIALTVYGYAALVDRVVRFFRRSK